MQSIESIKASADNAGVGLVMHVDAITLYVDPDRVQQTVVNLVGNAIKFSAAGSTITIEAHVIGGETLISVRDQGRGIPADKLSKIVERFEQVEASDERQKGGSGLGLAISRTIVQQHGGRIWAESTVGEGSTFFFTLPMGRQRASVSDEPVDKHAPGILVCDDDSEVLDVVCEMLRQQGYWAIPAQTGQEAVERASVELPAAILLDLAMPGRDGWATLIELKARPETRGIPVLILSGVERTGIEPTDNTAGWIAKPATADELHKMLSQVLGRQPGRPRVLVVEDDPDLARILTNGLATSGVETVHSGGSLPAEESSSEPEPDLVLLDVTRAQGSSVEVGDWLRRHNRLGRAPVVVYNGRDLHELGLADRDRLLEDPVRAVELLTKTPITPDEVQDLVKALLHQAVPTPVDTNKEAP